MGGEEETDRREEEKGGRIGWEERQNEIQSIGAFGRLQGILVGGAKRSSRSPMGIGYNP